MQVKFFEWPETAGSNRPRSSLQTTSQGAVAKRATKRHELPIFLRISIYYIEPFCVFLKGLFISLKPKTYLELLDLATPPFSGGIHTATEVALRQLGGANILIGMIQAVLLRCTDTDDIRVLRGLVLCYCVGDALHLYSLAPLGVEYFWNTERWTVLGWANFGFVYLGIISRFWLLRSVGFGWPGGRGLK